jgi:hypothetical protein
MGLRWTKFIESCFGVKTNRSAMDCSHAAMEAFSQAFLLRLLPRHGPSDLATGATSELATTSRIKPVGNAATFARLPIAQGS